MNLFVEVIFTFELKASVEEKLNMLLKEIL